MSIALLIVHLLVSMALIGCILIQTSKGGLGVTFGGESFYRTKRGAEKMVFYATIVCATLFFITSVVNLLVY